jgi:site-specific recombinase XerD
MPQELLTTESLGQKELWCRDPLRAFSVYIRSEAFLQSSHKEPRTQALSNDSIEVYSSMFSRFILFIQKKQLTLFTVNAEEIYQFLTQTKESIDTDTGLVIQVAILNSAIQFRYLRLLERTFSYLEIQPSPTDHLLFGALRDQYQLKGRNMTTLILSHEQIQLFLNHLPRYVSHDQRIRKDRISNAWRKQRDRALQCMLLGAGLKVAEVIALRIDEIDKSVQLDGTLKISLSENNNPQHEKHASFSTHTTFLRAEFVPEVLDWLKQRSHLHIRGELLFPNNYGEPLDKASVYRQVQQSFKRAGINIERMGGRTLRNSFAAQEHLSGTCGDELMGKLGLVKDESLEIYVEAAKNNCS